ncbi:hypothetical protein [Hyunsoonleella sp. 2307UL5-6]|uniref:hypothetical protein n=1 Tax=Hyunsoonleella sp. 2307UL5-6 TaxID=3384768 RepID=UPI0039BD2850
MVLVFKYLVPKGYTGISIFPFIFLNHKDLKSSKTLINHEKIHLQQQLELLIIPFYVWYIIEFFIRLLYFKNWHIAYKTISFEREAYARDYDLNYLKHRKFWAFLMYIKA